MTTAVAGWDPPVDRLAEVDSSLRHLRTVLDRLDGGHAQVHEARWTPGGGCRLACSSTSAQGVRTFRDVTVSPQGWSERDYRDDPALPGLAAATDPGTVAARLAGLMGPAASWSVEPVRYRPGSRCVLRYTGRGPGACTLYAKAFSAAEFAAVAPVLEALSSVPELDGVVPSLVALWPDLHVAVLTAAPGRSASTVLAARAAPTRAAVAVAGDLGRLVAQLHRQDLDPGRDRTALERLAAVPGELGPMLWVDPQLGDRCARVVRALADRLPDTVHTVLVHGALRPGQVVVRPDGRLTLLDVDGATAADPALDLGSMLAHLTWAGVRHPAARPAADRTRSSFLAAYEDAAAPVEPGRLRWWEGCALLVVAARRFRRLETRSWSRVPALVEAAEAMVAVPARRAGRPGRTARAGRATPPALLSDPRLLTRVADELRAAAGGSGARPVVTAAEQLPSAAGRRSVVRYSVRGLGQSSTTEVVAKAFTEPHRAVLLHEHLRLLSEGPFGEGDLQVPQPVGVLPDVGVVLYRWVPGTPLLHLADPGDVRGGLRGAARWLARLHASGVVLPRTWSPAREAATTGTWAQVVSTAHPALAARAHRLAQSWPDLLTGVAPSSVPLHKDFHAGHVLVADTVSVVDLDEARQGDPAFDVAHFCAYLEAFGPSSDAVDARHEFVEQYTADRGPLAQDAMAAYAAYTWLKIARQWTLGTGPCRTSTAEQRRTGAAAALERGLACLGA